MNSIKVNQHNKRLAGAFRNLQGENSGKIVDDDHREWYQRLFSPSVTAGILRPGDLAGYRNGPIYIRRTMHVPPSCEAVRDAMPVLFDLRGNLFSIEILGERI